MGALHDECHVNLHIWPSMQPPGSPISFSCYTLQFQMNVYEQRWKLNKCNYVGKGGCHGNYLYTKLSVTGIWKCVFTLSICRFEPWPPNLTLTVSSDITQYFLIRKALPNYPLLYTFCSNKYIILCAEVTNYYYKFNYVIGNEGYHGNGTICTAKLTI